MRIVARQHYAHEWTAIDEGNPDSPTGLGNSPDEARDDLMRQLDNQRCEAFDCEWPDCACGERGK